MVDVARPGRPAVRRSAEDYPSQDTAFLQASPPAWSHRSRTRRVALVGAFAVTAAVLGPLVGNGVAGKSGAHSAPLAPAIRGDDLRHPGSPVELQVPPGRPAVVSFFASWCEPCKRELPVLAAASRRLGDRVAFLGVDVRDSRTGAVAMLDAAGAGYPAVGDPDGAVTARFGLQGMPSTAFVTPDGHVAGVVLGRLTSGRLAGWLARLGVR